MFDQLSARLTEAVRQVTGRGRITEDNVRETARAIRMALLEADVALPVAKGFVERVRERALGQDVAKSLNPGQAFVKIVHDELVGVLGGDASPISQHGHPVVIMLVGLQGAGKTTTGTSSVVKTIALPRNSRRMDSARAKPSNNSRPTARKTKLAVRRMASAKRGSEKMRA
jgi:signal recognition particle subunit SRP54